MRENMSEIKNGGPAFPCDEQIRDSMIYQPEPGLSIRDYFAAKALPQVMADNPSMGDLKIAQAAYSLADAMIKARES